MRIEVNLYNKYYRNWLNQLRISEWPRRGGQNFEDVKVAVSVKPGVVFIFFVK